MRSGAENAEEHVAFVGFDAAGAKPTRQTVQVHSRCTRGCRKMLQRLAWRNRQVTDPRLRKVIRRAETMKRAKGA